MVTNKNNIGKNDPRPIFDIRLIPLQDKFKNASALKKAAVKAAIPDLAIAGMFLYALYNFTDIKSSFRNNMEGLVIIELIVLIIFPLGFRIFATEEKKELRETRTLSFMTGWINVLNLLFFLAILIELAYLTSLKEGREWIPLQLFILISAKIYSVFFSGEKKITPQVFCARLTARLAGGLFCGIFAYFFAVIPFGLLLNPDLLSEMCMLLVGYVFFSMMGIFSLFKQDFLYFLGAPFKNKNKDDGEMICEICYPRLEMTKSEFKSLDSKIQHSEKPKISKGKKSYAFIVLLITLLLPAIFIAPFRSEFIDYAKEKNTEIRKNKIAWEDRFNLGAAIVFSTCMVWILMVATMMMARDKNLEKHKKQ